MVRHGLTDEQWALIMDIFPVPAKTGRPPTNRRLIFEGILWILRTGAPWRDLPDCFGPWETCFGCFNRWNRDGLLTKILNRLRSARVDIGAFDMEVWCVDGTIIRAHRCAGGAEKKGMLRIQLTRH